MPSRPAALVVGVWPAAPVVGVWPAGFAGVSPAGLTAEVLIPALPEAPPDAPPEAPPEAPPACAYAPIANALIAVMRNNFVFIFLFRLKISRQVLTHVSLSNEVPLMRPHNWGLQPTEQFSRGWSSKSPEW